MNGYEEDVVQTAGQRCGRHLHFPLPYELKLNPVALSLSDAVSLLPRQVLNYCLPQL
jgi:hypothetical protein